MFEIAVLTDSVCSDGVNKNNNAQRIYTTNNEFTTPIKAPPSLFTEFKTGSENTIFKTFNNTNNTSLISMYKTIKDKTLIIESVKVFAVSSIKSSFTD